MEWLFGVAYIGVIIIFGISIWAAVYAFVVRLKEIKNNPSKGLYRPYSAKQYLPSVIIIIAGFITHYIAMEASNTVALTAAWVAVAAGVFLFFPCIFGVNVFRLRKSADGHKNNDILNSKRQLSWAALIAVVTGLLLCSAANLVIIKAGYGDAWDTYANGEVREMAAEITNGCSTEYDKALALYVWMSENMTYDIDYKASATWYSAPSKVLKDKRGVCEEFAGLYAALCHSVGLRCYVVSGSLKMGEGNHAWNIVYADGVKYRVDTTMGAQSIRKGLPITFDSSQYDQYFYVFSMH